MSTTPTDVATFDPAQSAYPVLFEAAQGGGQFAALIEDNFGEDGFSVNDLDRIHIPAAGGTQWEIPDEEPTKTIEGVIVFWGTTRSYWEKALDEVEETEPPQCASSDGKFGHGEFGPNSSSNPTGRCSECPMNVWGTGKGNSKACKEQRQLWMLLPGQILPIQVSLPPTSIKGFRQYMTRLTSKGKPYHSVVTRLTLKTEKMGPNKVAVAVPERASDLAPAEAQAASLFGAQIQVYLNQAVRAQVAETAPAEGGDSNDVFDDALPEPPEDLRD